jgi:hypothetical protein
MDCDLREFDWRSHRESNRSFRLEGDFNTFLVRIIVLANSDNVINSTYHNR